MQPVSYQSQVDCKPSKEELFQERISPPHQCPDNSKTWENYSNEKEMTVNDFYLGYDESSDDWDTGMPTENQESGPQSPIIINFCHHSDVEDNSPLDTAKDTVICSPQGSDNCSYLSPDAVSLNSVENGLVIVEVEEKQQNGSVENKPVSVEEQDVETITTDIMIEDRSGAGEMEVGEISPLRKCLPTIPFFVSSFDYNHKLGKLDKNELNSHHYQARVYDMRRSCRSTRKSRKRYGRRSRPVKTGTRNTRRKKDSYTVTRLNVNGEHSPVNNSVATESPEKQDETHKCPQCNFLSSKKKILEHYCNQHFRLSCPSCDESFQEPQYLQHCKNCKTTNAKLSCPHCELVCTASSLLSLAMHITLTHPIKNCVVCSENFVPQKFVEHAKSCFFQPQESCTCPFCEKEVLFANLSDHILVHPIAMCPLCSQDISQNEAVQHMESCYLEKVNDSEESLLATLFNCPICKQRYSFERMPQHIIKMHLYLDCVFCYTGLLQDEMVDHLMLCCRKHQNMTNGDSKK